MASRCRDERGDHANKIVVHVAGVTERLGRSGHDGGHLCLGSGAHFQRQILERTQEGQGRERTSWLVWTKEGLS